MSGELASEKPDPGELANEQQQFANDNMRQEVVLKRTELEKMKKQLDPFDLIDVNDKTILDFRKSIKSITEFFESKKSTIGEFIKDTDGLCDKLGDIMIKLNSSKKSWDRSQSGGQGELQISEAEERYQKLLKDCRKLIDEALAFFLVE